jgi:hypothetical protein
MAIAGNAVKAFKPTEVRLGKKIAIGLGAFVLTSMITDAATTYAEKTFDDGVEFASNLMGKKTEKQEKEEAETKAKEEAASTAATEQAAKDIADRQMMMEVITESNRELIKDVFQESNKQLVREFIKELNKQSKEKTDA